MVDEHLILIVSVYFIIIFYLAGQFMLIEHRSSINCKKLKNKSEALLKLSWKFRNKI